MDARKMRGLAVVTLSEAERLGRVQDVVFETSPLRAAGLRLETQSGTRFVALDDVRSVGPDAITVETTLAGTRADSDLASRQLPSLDDLCHRKVVDESGVLIGTIDHIDIDPATGALGELSVRRHELFGLGGSTTAVEAGQVISIGSELITVRATDGDRKPAAS